MTIQDGNLDGLLNGEGEGEGEFENPDLPGEGEGEGEVPPYLRDLSEDEVYDRLNRVNEIPDQFNGLESRLSGSLGDLTQRLSAMEKGIPTQAAFDADKLTSGLEAYDPQLAKILVPLLKDAFQVSAMDENTLRPYFDEAQGQNKQWMGEQIVMSAYAPETLGEIIPPVQDGKFMPEGQRHKDFINWYTQQGYQTQQSLLTFGAPYVNSLRSFERWEKTKNEGRANSSKNKTTRLANGQMPTSQHRKTPQAKPASLDAEFAAGFNEAFKEVQR